MGRPKFRKNQVVKLLGFDANDPRALGVFVKDIGNGTIRIKVEVLGKIRINSYPATYVRPLSERER